MWKLLCSTLRSRQPLTDSYLSDCECNNSTNNLSSGAAELALNPLPLTLSLKYTPPHWAWFSLSLSLLLSHSLSSGEENIWASAGGNLHSIVLSVVSITGWLQCHVNLDWIKYHSYLIKPSFYSTGQQDSGLCIAEKAENHLKELIRLPAWGMWSPL